MVYNKLVRDRIPQIIRAQGELPVVRILEETEYHRSLLEKLSEETEEYRADRTLEELADILEVVFSLGETHGCSREDLLRLCEEKRSRRGGFRERLFLTEKKPLQYEKAREEDVDVIFRQCRALIDAYEDVDSIPYEKVLSWVKRKISDNLSQYVRVCLDGKTAAYYRLHPENGETELDDLYVLPEYRGMGIGTAILETCFREAPGSIFLYVFQRNTGALRLYERMGFRRVQDVGETRMILRRDG